MANVKSPVAVPEQRALFAAVPALRERIAHLPLGSLPTPIDRVALGDGRELLVKRDDLCATTYAGNKLRKLEFLLAHARARGARRLITAGACGSHHAFATAYHGRRAGFAVTLVLFPQRRTAHVRDVLLLDCAAGAELLWASRMETVPYGMWRARFQHRADRTYVIPPGGSSAIGTLGYVSAGLELARQLDDGVPRPSAVHVAVGTMGTAAGIAIGLAWAGLDIPVVGTRITSRMVTNESMLAALIRGTVSLLRRAGAAVPPAAAAQRLIEIRHDQLGAGYGQPTAAAAEAEQLFAAAGLRLDATYTAKAAASLLATPAADRLPLFWHTLSAVEPRDLLRDVTADMLPRQFMRYLERV